MSTRKRNLEKISQIVSDVFDSLESHLIKRLFSGSFLRCWLVWTRKEEWKTSGSQNDPPDFKTIATNVVPVLFPSTVIIVNDYVQNPHNDHQTLHQLCRECEMLLCLIFLINTFFWDGEQKEKSASIPAYYTPECLSLENTKRSRTHCAKHNWLLTQRTAAEQVELQ